MKIGVLGKISKVKNESTIDEIVEFLRSLGYDTVKFSTPLDINGVDVVVVLGGDAKKEPLSSFYINLGPETLPRKS